MQDTAEPLVNRAQVAAIFGVSENTISKWISRPGDPMPVETEGGNGVAYEFRVSDCRDWYDRTRAAEVSARRETEDFVNQQRMEFLGVPKTDKKAGLSPAQIRDLANAELVYMQAARQRRALVPLDEMVDLLDAIFSEVREAVNAMPDWLEREFSLTPEQVEDAVAYGDEILALLSERIAAAHLVEIDTSAGDRP